ncbi:MAG: hypothetical protein Q9205_007600 [Flavoplaca limonia]
MRRSSMRRGSAVLLSILPLLAPTYALPTYMGNEGTVVAHMNAERAAAPEADRVNLDIPDPEDSASILVDDAPVGEEWLPTKRQEKRQAPSSDTIAAGGSPGWGGFSAPERPAAPAAAGPSYGSALGNIGSYGPSMRLPVAKRAMEAEKAAQRGNRVTLDYDFVPEKVNSPLPAA